MTISPMSSELNELLGYLTPRERAEIDKLTALPPSQSLDDYPDWRTFLTEYFSIYVKSEFAPHQVEFWEWVWSIEKDVRPLPFVSIWPRGGGKSSSAEMAAASVALREKRKYILYVCGTQESADKHVATIAAMFENIGVQRALNMYGQSKGWRRNRLSLGNGATIDALGLDTTMRGVKVEEQRPDMEVLDDVDERHDSTEIVRKKVETLTQTVLAAGSNDCAVLFVQNLIHSKSIASQLANGTADFLLDRIQSGPYQAIEGLELDGKDIVAGTAIWEGQSIAICQSQIVTWGLSAFIREAQQDVAQAENGVWKQQFIDQYRVSGFPVLDKIVVGVDPPGKNKTECGIVVNGRAYLGGLPHVFTLEDASHSGTPDEWANTVVACYNKWKANAIIAEQNYGGDMVKSTIHHVNPSVPVVLVSATRGKEVRAEPCATMCQEGREHHVGTFVLLEKEQVNWVPGLGMLSPNRMDAHVWGMTDLLGIGADAQGWIDKSKTMLAEESILAAQPAIHRRVTLDDIARQIGDARPPKENPISRGMG